VNRLTVPVASITASGAMIDVEVPIAELQPPDVESGVPVLMVTVRGTLSEAGAEYLFQGTVSGAFEHVCDRCLDAVMAPFDVEVAWVFQQGLRETPCDEMEEEDADEPDVPVLGFSGSEIDLAPGVWEEVVLAMPSKFVCREDCAGLCPGCGANLNRGPCACRGNGDVKIGNKGLAGLAELFPNLPPKRSEE
jgi:uncharacterized protein